MLYSILLFISVSLLATLANIYFFTSPYFLVISILVSTIMFIKLPKRLYRNIQNRIFVIYVVFFILQGFFLGSDLTRFMQPIVLLILYALFYNKTIDSKIDIYEIKKISLYVLCILPLFFINFDTWSDKRLGGLFWNPNTTAYITLFLLPFFIMGKLNKALKLIGYIIIGCILIMVASRGAILACILGFIVFYIISKSGWWSSFTGLCLLIICVFLISTYAVDILTFFIDELNISSTSRIIDTTYNGRDIIQLMAFEDIKRSPIIGNGFEAGKYELGEHILGTHNSYLDILVRSGIVGLILFVFLIVSFLLDISKILNQRNKAIASMVVATWIALSASGSIFMGYNFFTFYILLLLGILIHSWKT